MATRKIVSKHIAHAATSYVGRDGELVVDTDTNTLKITDGSTPGGVTLNTDGSSSVDYSSIEVVSTAGSTNSGSPTALTLDKTVTILTHVDGSVRYFSIPDGSTNGTIKIFRLSANSGVSSSSRVLSGNIDGMTTYGLGVRTAIQLLWYETKWYLIAETEN